MNNNILEIISERIVDFWEKICRIWESIKWIWNDLISIKCEITKQNLIKNFLRKSKDLEQEIKEIEKIIK